MNNVLRFIKFMFINPNSSEGLIIRAELLEEDAEKLDGRDRESYIMYARVLRELSLKNWSIKQNKDFIKENMRKP